MSFPGLLIWCWETRNKQVGHCGAESDVQLLTVGDTEGSSETGFARTWHPAPLRTMRDGLAHKSMPVGNVHLK